MKAVTKDTTLEQVLRRPGAEKILEKHGAPCIHCPMAAYEMGKLKLSDIAGAYGLDIKAMLKDLNPAGKKARPVRKGKK